MGVNIQNIYTSLDKMRKCKGSVKLEERAKSLVPLLIIAKPDEKPEYCKGHVCIECLRNGDGMCPHFNWCSVEKKVKKKFRKMIRKIYKA